MDEMIYDPLSEILREAGYDPYDKKSFSTGLVIATCRLVDVVRIEDQQQIYNNSFQTWFIPPYRQKEYAFGDYTAGRYAWLLFNIKPLYKPIPAKGMLGLWDWKEDQL